MADLKVGASVMVPFKVFDEIDWSAPLDAKVEARTVLYLGTIKRIDGNIVTIWIAGMKPGSKLWAYQMNQVEDMESFVEGFDYV